MPQRWLKHIAALQDYTFIFFSLSIANLSDILQVTLEKVLTFDIQEYAGGINSVSYTEL